VCAAAVREEGVWLVFKSLPGYTGVLEHLTFEQGLDYLREIDPGVDMAPMFENDVLGSPAMYAYPHGRMSPTTLRYIKVACDIRRRFPNVRTIAEIGAGYGGQRFVLSKLLPQVKTYVIIDLPPVLALIDKYLSRLKCPDYTLVNALDNAAVADCQATDLVISNYAFAECTFAVREHYISTVLRRAASGYMTMNMTPEEVDQVRRVLEMMGKDVSVLPESPQTGVMNSLLVYGPRGASQNGHTGDVNG
jgi:hypothetical protein